MATTSNHGNQLSQSEDYEQFMEELKRKHDSWNVDCDMGRGRKPLGSLFLQMWRKMRMEHLEFRLVLLINSGVNFIPKYT
ncbi:uncharacterized protein LOC141706760 isoform X3 [Apium graveolens]|uniref:uncharacterized protein LOC141706760 isoform X3 n=1 Tax=Apium graveolens TaxID=4045 RepID=UPI003D78D98C